MTFNVRKTSAFAVFLAVLFASTLAFALKVPPPPEYKNRKDPNTPGGERVGADEDFDGYPADPDEVEGQLYTDTLTEYHKYSPHWTGAAWGLGVQGGASWMYGQAFAGKSVAPSLGVFAQMTTLLNVVDIIGSIQRGRWDAKIGEEEVDALRWDFSVSATIHPMFFSALSGSWFSRFLSQFYLMGGGNLTVQKTKGDTIDSRFVRPGFHAGAGIDTYITNPNRRASLWLGVQYRWTNTAGGLDDEIFVHNWTREHQVLARITLRFNGNIINTVPGPKAP